MVSSIIRLSSVTSRPSTSSKDFSCETTWPISIKFHMEPLGNEGKKIYRFDPGHMTKMAALPIYSRTSIVRNASDFQLFFELSKF